VLATLPYSLINRNFGLTKALDFKIQLLLFWS